MGALSWSGFIWLGVARWYGLIWVVDEQFGAKAPRCFTERWRNSDSQDGCGQRERKDDQKRSGTRDVCLFENDFSTSNPQRPIPKPGPTDSRASAEKKRSHQVVYSSKECFCQVQWRTLRKARNANARYIGKRDHDDDGCPPKLQNPIINAVARECSISKIWVR